MQTNDNCYGQKKKKKIINSRYERHYAVAELLLQKVDDGIALSHHIKEVNLGLALAFGDGHGL